MEDKDLVRAAREGDDQAFEELYYKYKDRFFGLAYGILGDRASAEDIVQVTFLKVWQNLNRFNGDSSFYTWAYKICKHKALDVLRYGGRRVQEYRYEDVHVRDDTSLQGNVPDADEGFNRGETAAALRAAFATLSEKHRTVFRLREIDGLSYEEIASVCGTPIGTIMSRLYHARQNMQLALIAGDRVNIPEWWRDRNVAAAE